MKNYEKSTDDIFIYEGEEVKYVSMLPYPLEGGENVCVQFMKSHEIIVVKSTDLLTKEAIAGKKLYMLQEKVKHLCTGDRIGSWEKLSPATRRIFIESAKHIEFK